VVEGVEIAADLDAGADFTNRRVGLADNFQLTAAAAAGPLCARLRTNCSTGHSVAQGQQRMWASQLISTRQGYGASLVAIFERLDTTDFS
jgi:hypothetical protein